MQGPKGASRTSQGPPWPRSQSSGTSSPWPPTSLSPWQSHTFLLCYSKLTSSRLGPRHSLSSSEPAAHRWYRGVVLICVFQKTNASTFSYACLLAMCISSMNTSSSLSIFFSLLSSWFLKSLCVCACVCVCVCVKQYSECEFFAKFIFLPPCSLFFPLMVTLDEEKFLF